VVRSIIWKRNLQTRVVALAENKKWRRTAYCPNKSAWKYVTNYIGLVGTKVIIWWVFRNWRRFSWNGYTLHIQQLQSNFKVKEHLEFRFLGGTGHWISWNVSNYHYQVAITLSQVILNGCETQSFNM
jgi:hypothetical protein